MSADKPVSLAKAFEELEKIVASFEEGHVDLERDLPKFERGLQLAQVCRKRLKELENRVHTIEKRFAEPESAAAEERGES